LIMDWSVLAAVSSRYGLSSVIHAADPLPAKTQPKTQRGFPEPHELDPAKTRLDQLLVQERLGQTNLEKIQDSHGPGIWRANR